MRAVILICSFTIASSGKAQVLCGTLEAPSGREPLGGIVVGLVPNAGTRSVEDTSRTDAGGQFCLRPKRSGIYASVILLRSGDTLKVTAAPIVGPDSLSTTIVVDTIRKRAAGNYGIETPVRMAQPARMGGYPADLKDVKARGSVVVTYVVNPSGRVDPASMVVLRSDDARFTRAVREQLRWMRFHPATVDGRKIHRLVNQEFSFSPPP
jgi:TonB family protein